MKKLSFPVLVVVLGLTLGTAFVAGHAEARSSPKHATLHVKIVSDANTIGAYSPKKIVVHKGDRIIFRNTSNAPHTVTADKGKAFDSGNINTGATWTYTAKHTGTFTYHCMYHPGMHGTIVVKS